MDGWWLGRRLTKRPVLRYAPKVAIDYDDPKDLLERRSVAGDCIQALNFGIKTLVDDMDDRVNEAYAAWPARFYLVGIDGKVVYAGGMVPFDYKPEAFMAAIEGYLQTI